MIKTGHNIQIIAEGSCGDLGTIFREAAGGLGGSDGPSGGSGEGSTPGSAQGEAPANPASDLTADIPAGLVPRQEEAFDLLEENSAILGGGAAGETLAHFGTCWDGKVTNPSNPARRDVAQLQSNSYIVLQWNQDNPGLWVSFLLQNAPQTTLTDPEALPLSCRMASECWFYLECARAPRRAPKWRLGDSR
jgi:hypothetical protein